MSTPLVLLLLFIGLLLAPPVLLGFLSAFLEKRPIWPFMPLEDQNRSDSAHARDVTNPYAPPGSDETPRGTEYTEFTNRKASRAGFTPLGTFSHGKSKFYRIRYNFWLSPDRVVLALVGGGTLASIKLNATWLFTRFRDGRRLLTIDDAKAGDSDPSGLTVQEVLTHADFEELLARHRERVAASAQAPEPYSKDDPLGDHRAFRMFRTEQLVERGLVRFVDAQRNVCKYTLRGAIVVAFRTTLRQYRQMLRNQGRQSIRRPGQDGYVLSDRRPGSARAAAQLNKVELFFWIMLGVGAMSAFTSGPARTRAQSLFRLAVTGIALAGLLATYVLKVVAKRTAASTRAPSSAWSKPGGEAAEMTLEEDD